MMYYTNTVKETYNNLIVYLSGLRRLYDKGIDAKSKMEEILRINDSGLPDLDYAELDD